MGLGTQPKEGHNDYSTLIGQANRQEAGADMGTGLGTSSTTPQRDIVPEQQAWQPRSQAGVCVSLHMCPWHWWDPSGEPFWLWTSCLWCSEPIECSRHGRMQTTFSSVTIQGLCDLIDTAPLSSHHRWGQDSTMDLLTLIHSLSLPDRSQDMCPCALQRSHLYPC